MGQSGRAILAAIIQGETDPAKLVLHVSKRVKAPPEKIIDDVGFAPFLVGNRFLHLFDFGCTLISRTPLSDED